MSIRLTREQIDVIGDLLFRCDACGDDGEVYRQGENDGELSRVSVGLPATVELDLCRRHLRVLGPRWVVHGAMFCPHCNGLVERTGRTRPIENGDGIWEEFECENNRNAITFTEHFHEWEPLD